MSWQCRTCDEADVRCYRAGKCMAHLGPAPEPEPLTEEELAQLDPELRRLLTEDIGK